MTLQPTTVLRVAAAEMRTSRRLVRFWTIVAVLSIISLAGYALSCLILSFTAPYSPSIGAATPLYLLGGIDPTFFLAFQMAVLLLLFDAGHQHTRNRIDEVLDSMPVTNLEYLTGRVLGISFLLWMVAAANVLLMQTFGVAANAFNFSYAEPIQLHSIINLLLIDAPATLLIWGSFVVFLSVVLRIRVLTVAVGLAAMFAWFFLVLNVPYSLLSIVSASSNDSLFVSDLIPEFASWQTILVRIATLLGALALAVAAAIAMRRRDGTSILASASTILVAIGLCGGAYALSATSVLQEFGNPARWHEAHKAQHWSDSVDVLEISGTVQIYPGKRLDIDLSLSLKIDSDPAEQLIFTFNPGMTISNLEFNGSPASFSFQDGLLKLDIQDALTPDSAHALRIVAHGRPNPRFAHFDSALNYMTNPAVPIRSVRILGKDSSVFRSNFVALMPGVHWYPMPRPALEDFASSDRGTDYFNVDLSVGLSKESLRLVGTGTAILEEGSESTYRVTSKVPVPEIGLFAAEYESASVDVDGVAFSMHLHKRHAKNMNLTAGIEEAFATEISNRLQRLTEHGLTVPQERISFVEVPNRLRTIGGGWRMDNVSSLPGIALMKAQAFPRTNFNLAIRFAKREESPEQIPATLANLLFRYFEMGIGVDNLWTTVPEHLWTHVTSATGDHAEALDQVVLALISFLTSTPQQFFSVYSTFHVANTTAVSPYTLNYGSDPDGWAPYQFEVRESEVSYGKRQSIWTYMEGNGLSELPSSNGNQRDLELMLTKTNAIADGLLHANGIEKILGWLTALRLQFAGQNYTFDDLIQFAKEHEIVYDPFLTEWLEETPLPAYAFKLVSMERISDDEHGGPRYQTSLVVRNVGPISGFIRVEYPHDQNADRRFPFLLSTEGIRIEGNSASQINVVNSYALNRLSVVPHLSLNRQPMTLWPNAESISESPDEEPAPFEESSTWIPSSNGIVVDDLDSGFSANQTVPKITQSANLGPFDWFREHRLEIELEGGLPSWGQMYGSGYWGTTTRQLWNRFAIESAYGKYRRTSTSLWNTHSTTFPTVSFEAKTPEASLWRLEYHIPATRFIMGRRNTMKYQFVVSNESTTYDVEFESNPETPGWHELGQFQLTAGPVGVELVRAVGYGPVFADAIRWIKADDTPL
ncbi:MAG: hypothetical protein OXG08_05320 [Gammaproteobacteria bacterium]|nr:hypothetical protein [Gammaproteobacteria bacterium]